MAFEHATMNRMAPPLPVDDLRTALAQAQDAEDLLIALSETVEGDFSQYGRMSFGYHVTLAIGNIRELMKGIKDDLHG